MEIINDLHQQFLRNKDDVSAIKMGAYMKNRFAFYGIPSPKRKGIVSNYYKSNTKPENENICEILKQGFEIDQREMQYVVIDLLNKYKKGMPINFLKCLKKCIITKSWWDTVDGLASHVGYLVKQYPELAKKMDQWIEDDNFWIRRVALIHQLKFGIDTDEKRLFSYCLKQKEEKEFFIRKAIGWSLRQYSKFEPHRVSKFVQNNELSPLSKREALKVINKNKK